MIKFIFTTFLIIMFMRLVAPVLLRWLVAFLFKKHVRNSGFGTQQQSYGQPQQAYNHTASNPTGKIKIDYIPEEQTKGKKEFTGGEYVDYEEVK
jgi:hypothetical protein